MRSRLWEVALVCLLLIVAAGAFSALSVVRARAPRPTPAVAAPGGDGAVRAALSAVKMYAPFALQRNTGGVYVENPSIDNINSVAVYIDQATIEKIPVTNAGASPQWLITGQATGDNIDATNFRWSVRVAESSGQFSAREMQLDGEVIYTAPTEAEAAPAL